MISWLFWNPDRVAFTLPGLGHPIAWYGLLFASGMFLGYQILFFIISRWFLLVPKIFISEVADSSLFCTRLATLFPAFCVRLPLHMQRALREGNLQKSAMEHCLSELNRWLLETEEKGSVLPKGVRRFAKRWLTDQQTYALSRRLQLEEKIGKALGSLRQRARLFCDRLSFYLLLGIVVGARLGHFLFYEDWLGNLSCFSHLFHVWEGGLASHGGIVGLIIAGLLFCRRYSKDYPWISLIHLLDLLALPALCSAAFIRIGNFVNQEVLGTATTAPWAIVFGNPVDGSAAIPRHPAQLYEALFYAASFFVASGFFPRRLFRPGQVSGATFVFIFVFRFLIEFIKCHQSAWLGQFPFTMGQLLSVPVIAYGVWLLIKNKPLSLGVMKQSA